VSTYPNSPRLVKGALIGVDVFNPVASVVVFQYNPDTMTRRLEARAAAGDGDRGEAQRLTGPPKETITLTVEIDATDRLEAGDAVAEKLGIYPELSSLEMLLYPKTAAVIANEVLAAIGTIEILPMEHPFTLLVWGLKRVVPVRVTAFSITEESYDPNLNPIRAKVELTLTVLTYQDYGVLHPGHWVFMAHQTAKEVMATIGGVRSMSDIRSIVPEVIL